MRIGILGGGQLAQMLIQAGEKLGLEFEVYTPLAGSPAGKMVPETVGSFEDRKQLETFINRCDLVTYEWENLSVSVLKEFAAQRDLFFPSIQILEIIADRYAQKCFFRGLEIPTASFELVSQEEQLAEIVRRVGVPGLLKTNRFGYDGKGQFKISTEEDLNGVWKTLGEVPLIYEKWVPFERELSLVACRSKNGEKVFYPLVENVHEKGILRTTLAPAESVSSEQQRLAESYAMKVFEQSDYVGVLALELFESNGRLLVNEMASRVHNTGHWTIEGAQTSQFENHLRAGLGYRLGSTKAKAFVAMLNLIGEIPSALESIQSGDQAFVHLYGKKPKPGRKVGHITLLASDRKQLVEKMRAVSTACRL